ncbi:MAG: toll/interleukin-1 receptor domain-containing protein, partial [Cyanobacteria bacterium J06598_3]
FLLCWSSSAKASKWVLKEAEYALALQDKDEFQRPDIKPVILEGPPIVPPPEGLEDLHFNDKIIYLINQS